MQPKGVKKMAITNETALVYCESQFGLVDGKTATGLIRHSGIYTVVGVIDSLLAGQDAGEVLGEGNLGIPIFRDLKDALSQLPLVPDCYIYGKAPLDTYISYEERSLIIEAMEKGMDIINGLHQFFSEDPEFVHMADKHEIKVKDIRKPPLLENLHVFSGQISKVNVPVIAVLGTDCACGKRTTATKLDKALNDDGIKSVLIATGQSGLMQGAMYGAAIDALTSQFVIGEIENAVVKAFENESPDIILVEGQSALSHPAFMSSFGILKGSMPDGIILQHAPGRKFRCDFPNLVMPLVESEIEMIEAISRAEVLAITLNHEGLSDLGVTKCIKEYEKRLQLPTTDVLSRGCRKLVETMVNHFPGLNRASRLGTILDIQPTPIQMVQTY
jgi:uncharacterized NAD-dependent epimerase/dehydratase family protein